MSRHHFKFYLDVIGGHIHMTVFSGTEHQTLANCGTLIFTVGEWQLFGALIGLGYDAPSSIKQHVLVTWQNEEKIMKFLSEIKGNKYLILKLQDRLLQFLKNPNYPDDL